METPKDQIIKQLSERNDDLENYFLNTIIPQLFFDKDLILRKFTPAALKQFKLSQEDVGKSINELENNLRYSSIVDNIDWVIKTSEVLEKEIQTNDLCWYQMNIIPYITKKENIANGVIITFVDITNRIKDLTDQEKLITDYENLLDTISHDIRNRLSGMLLSIHMLKESDYNDQEELKTFLQSLENGVSKIHNIIKELFEARSDKHKYEAVEELLNVENVLEDVQLALMNEINTSKTVIKTQIDCSEVIFPRRQLRSIIFNLVSNAIKFRSPDRDPEIFIKTTREENFIVISIKDNGIGIDPSKHEDIFSKYFRIEKTVEGSGVGLYLVKALITNAGGKIEIESQVGEGSEFKIYLKTKC